MPRSCSNVTHTGRGGTWVQVAFSCSPMTPTTRPHATGAGGPSGRQRGGDCSSGWLWAHALYPWKQAFLCVSIHRQETYPYFWVSHARACSHHRYVSTHLSDFVGGEQTSRDISLHTQKQINRWFLILPQQEFRKTPEVLLPHGGLPSTQI